MSNHLLIKDFTNKIRPAVETLTLEINKPQIDTKERMIYSIFRLMFPLLGLAL